MRCLCGLGRRAEALGAGVGASAGFTAASADRSDVSAVAGVGARSAWRDFVARFRPASPPQPLRRPATVGAASPLFGAAATALSGASGLGVGVGALAAAAGSALSTWGSLFALGAEAHDRRRRRRRRRSGAVNRGLALRLGRCEAHLRRWRGRRDGAVDRRLALGFGRGDAQLGGRGWRRRGRGGRRLRRLRNGRR